MFYKFKNKNEYEILDRVTTPCFYVRESIEIGKSLILPAPLEFQ